MKHSSQPSPRKLFSHLYIERRVLDHPKTRMIRSKFADSHVIIIDHYKEVFNRPSQSFAAQSHAKKLILAHKEGKFLHEGSQYSDGFDHHQFFYASSVMGCLYDCDYCYLQGLYPSANTVLFVNLEDAFAQLAPYLERDTLVATSYDTDTLAIESLTHQTTEWLAFAAEHEHLYLEIRTKSANIRALQDSSPNPRVTLAWTLSPQEIIERYEHATPSLVKRLKSLQEAIEAGWKVRLCIDPVIYTENFDTLYPALIDQVFETINPDAIEHLTLGSFRMSQSHLRALKKLRRSDVAFYPYAVKDEMVTYPEGIENTILERLLAKAAHYLPNERISNMATAIVTGTSSGIGEAIAQLLLKNGHNVIGLSRRRGDIHHPLFEHLPCDLSDLAVVDILREKLVKIEDLDILVNAAGFGRFEPHEELSFKVITDMIALNLTTPILLANALMRPLKKSKGMIINITSIEATRHSKFSALYSATKAGLRAFGLTLFEETRHSGIKVVTINPDMTETPFFDGFRFGVGAEEDMKLLTSDITQAVQYLLDAREGICVTEMTIRSQRFGITKKR